MLTTTTDRNGIRQRWQRTVPMLFVVVSSFASLALRLRSVLCALRFVPYTIHTHIPHIVVIAFVIIIRATDSPYCGCHTAVHRIRISSLQRHSNASIIHTCFSLSLSQFYCIISGCAHPHNSSHIEGQMEGTARYVSR